MKIAAIIIGLIAALFWVFAIKQMMEPSIMPLAVVIGASIIPGLLTWWAKILWDKSNTKKE